MNWDHFWKRFNYCTVKVGANQIHILLLTLTME